MSRPSDKGVRSATVSGWAGSVVGACAQVGGDDVVCFGLFLHIVGHTIVLRTEKF